MQRREVLQLLGASTLLPFVPRSVEGALAFGQAAHRAAGSRTELKVLSAAEARLVSDIAELIIPRTDTPGATDVGITPFIDHLLADWYPVADKDQFRAGLAEIDRRGDGRFVALAPERKAALLTTLDGAEAKPGSAEATFGRIKGLTVYGYFTSEKVVKEVTHEQIIPGRFEGCVPR